MVSLDPARTLDGTSEWSRLEQCTEQWFLTTCRIYTHQNLVFFLSFWTGTCIPADLEFCRITSQFVTRKVVNRDSSWKAASAKRRLRFLYPNQVTTSNHRCTWKSHLNLKELHLSSLTEGQFYTSGGGREWKFQDCIHYRHLRFNLWC